MLKKEGQWESLTTEERLVLLAIAHELPKINGTSVMDRDVIINSGLSVEDFWQTVNSLASKGLVEIEGGDTVAYFIAFSGDALTMALCEQKLAECVD